MQTKKFYNEIHETIVFEVALSEITSQNTQKPHSLASLRFLVQCLCIAEVFSDHLTKNSNLPEVGGGMGSLDDGH